MSHPSVDFNNIQNVLIIKLRHYGDVLLTSPVFQVLKTKFPHLSIDALVYDETKEMLLEHPSIRTIYGLKKTQRTEKKITVVERELTLIKQLKSCKYDLIIHLTESWRGAILSRLLKPKYSVVRKYQSRKSKFWMNSFSHHYSSPIANKRHTVEVHLDALRRIGVHPKENERDLILRLNTHAEKEIEKRLKKHEIENYIVIHPTSRWLFKCWDKKKMAMLINHLSEKGHTIVITAAPVKKELQMVEDILGAVKYPVINFAGSLSLQELAALIARSQLYFGLDSVPMHIASALKVPVVALFGPSGDIEWRPWKTKSTVIVSSKHPCRPCGQDGCGNSKVADCLTSIDVQTVSHHIDNILNPNS